MEPAGPGPFGDGLRAKIFFITLAVDDLGRSVAFYRDGLGWPTEGIVGQEFHDEVTDIPTATSSRSPGTPTSSAASVGLDRRSRPHGQPAAAQLPGPTRST